MQHAGTWESCCVASLLLEIFGFQYRHLYYIFHFFWLTGFVIFVSFWTWMYPARLSKQTSMHQCEIWPHWLFFKAFKQQQQNITFIHEGIVYSSQWTVQMQTKKTGHSLSDKVHYWWWKQTTEDLLAQFPIRCIMSPTCIAHRITLIFQMEVLNYC